MSKTAPEFGYGWHRAHGRPGLRNHVVALSTVALADRITQQAAEKVPGTLLLAPRFERGLRGADAALQDRMIRAIVGHPNTAAILLVTHDGATADAYRALFADAGKPVAIRATMISDGVDDAITRIAQDLRGLHVATAETARVPLEASDFLVALECGGSDASSAVGANPAIGRFVDGLLAKGGAAIVSETAEFLGGEPVVRDRCTDPALAERILSRIGAAEARMLEDGQDYRGINPTRENMEAGLTTLTEKTMGALCKIGESRFSGCLDFAESPAVPGLHFMDTPFFSPVSLTGMILAGAQVSLFAMGVFNPSGMPLAPTMKISANPDTLQRFGDSIDVDVSGLLTGETTLNGASHAIADTLVAFADGRPSRAEVRREGQVIQPRTRSAL